MKGLSWVGILVVAAAVTLCVRPAPAVRAQPTVPAPGAVPKPPEFVITLPWAEGVTHTVMAGYDGDSPKHRNLNDSLHPNDFYALDFDLASGEAVYPLAPGTVTYQGAATEGFAGYGTIIFINHQNGYWSLYAHLSRSDVITGQQVDPGTPIGAAGGTGTDEVHLHIALYKDALFQNSPKGIGPYGGQAVVPEPFANCTTTQGGPCESLTRGTTLRRIASSPPPVPADPVPPPVDYFALGDSVAAGHGLRDTGEPCRRSRYAYPYRVALELRQRYEEVNFPPEHHLACSGATATQPGRATLAEDPFKWIVPQVDYVLDHLDPSHPTVVSISIGANDFGWSDANVIKQRLYFDSDAAFAAWVQQTVARNKQILKTQVERLLRHRHVAVILHEYHNPFNESSVFFKWNPFGDRCGHLFRLCYQRTEDAIHAWNAALIQIYIELDRPERLQIAVVHAAFHAHESPRAGSQQSKCGDTAPEVWDSWIQHRDDEQSNSNPPIPADVAGDYPWKGDCFHPNIFGAIHYARAVRDDIERVMPHIVAQRIDMLTLAAPGPLALKVREQREVSFTVENFGQIEWPAGMVVLRQIGGSAIGPRELTINVPVPRGGIVELVLNIQAPSSAGTFDSRWQLTYDGRAFGDELRVFGVALLEDVSTDVQGMFELWLNDTWKQVRGDIDAFWEQTRRKIEEIIVEAVARELERLIQGICGAVPVSVVSVSGLAWWRRRTRRH